jgi:hypothetical protein
MKLNEPFENKKNTNMRKTLLIITLFIGLGNVNAQSDIDETNIENEWSETTKWINSKSDFYNISFDDGRMYGEIDQYFEIRNDDKLWLKEKGEYRTQITKGSILSISTIDYWKKDQPISKLRLNGAFSVKYYFKGKLQETTSISFLDIYVRNSQEIPERLHNAFNSLLKMQQPYSKFLKNKKNNKIKSYGEKY